MDDYTALLGYLAALLVIDQAVANFVNEPIILKAGIRK